MAEADTERGHPAQEPVTVLPELSRRALLGAAAAGAAGLVAGGFARPLLTASRPGPPTPLDLWEAASATHSFFGAHQAGITTPPPQGHIHFAAFDMSEGTDRHDLVTLLRDWSRAAERMTQGLEVGRSGPTGDPGAPPADTGEALGLPASRLTVTIGLGPTLFERAGVDRYGIAAQRPAELEPLPPFVGDALDVDRSDGDICLQVCADDPQVVVHAMHNLLRIGIGRATVRWSQTGFVPASADRGDQKTPRNLMGFKDGTNNILDANEGVIDQHVWLPPDSTPAWLAGGTYLVIRKIAMLIEHWDRQPMIAQQAIIGRTKESGGPLSGGEEFTAPDFEAKLGGAYVIDRAAHVRLAHPSSNGGIRILRRGYNYVDGTDARGHLAAGLLFISYQRSPAQFTAIQEGLARDLLNPFIRHIGSAVFVVPPGTSTGGFVGETLLG